MAIEKKANILKASISDDKKTAEEVIETEALRRIILDDSQEKPKTYSLKELAIDLSEVEYDENDGWE